MEDIELWSLKYEPCLYSKRLLDKIYLLNKSIQNENLIDITEIKKAIYYAKKYHANQMRQTGEPYYTHPIEVAHMVCDYLFRTDIIVTSLLHDVIEDTTLTAKMLKCIFSPVIADNVLGLTRIKNGQKISSKELIDSLWIQKKYNLLLVKLIDRLHNISTLHIKPIEKIVETTQETINDFLVLAAYLEVQDVEKKLVNLCSKFINERHLIDDDHSLPFAKDKDFLSLLFQNDLCHK